MTTPQDRGHSTIFGLDDGSSVGLLVFVNPYTAKVLGSDKPGSGIVGLSNRLHGSLNNQSSTVSLPTVSALWDEGALMRDYVVGDVVLEVLDVWTLVLACSGLYLWWPRRSRVARNRTQRAQTLRFAHRQEGPGALARPACDLRGVAVRHHRAHHLLRNRSRSVDRRRHRGRSPRPLQYQLPTEQGTTVRIVLPAK